MRISELSDTEERALLDLLHNVQELGKAYPLDMFPEPDMVKANKVLKENNISLDGISALNMRHVITRLLEVYDQSLKEQEHE